MDMIEKHEDSQARNAALCTFLSKIQDSSDLPVIRNHIISASKALAMCSAGEQPCADTCNAAARSWPSAWTCPCRQETGERSRCCDGWLEVGQT